MNPTREAHSLLNNLNPEQRKAVEDVEGPLLILAGAGSGKTRVITYRIAHLIGECGVRPENILAVTFTNKAADQMKERVFRLLQTQHSSRPLICTFHSLCVRILRKEIERLAYTRDFAIYDESDQESLMKTCLKEVGLDSKAVTPRAVLSQISYAKNHGRTPAQFYASATDPRRQQYAVLYERYEKELKRRNALDFDDLLLRTAELFSEFSEVREHYNGRFHYILVDEYQDTNQTQYRLIRHLTRARQNLCVVGDEDQSIYGWRGADIQNILSFEQDYPEARIIKLEQNYRSTQIILDAASAVVANNLTRKGKTLWTARSGGERIRYFEAVDAEAEALFVTETLLALQEQVPQAHCAVLYRTNAQSRQFEEAFRRSGIAYHMVGGFSFYDRAEIKDILSYLKFAMNPDDTISLQRIINTPSRGIGDTTYEKLTQWAQDKGISLWQAMDLVRNDQALSERSLNALAGFTGRIRSLQEKLEVLRLPELIQFIIETSGYRRMLENEDSEESRARIENLNELINATADAAERGESLRDFLDHAALVSDQDSYDETATVSLMTIHSAKGLEFPVVFVVGLEEGLFPHSRTLVAQEELEEERRLFYVAMTRAKDQLLLSRVRWRRHYGGESSSETEPSRFLSEIPFPLLDNRSRATTARKVRKEYEGVTYNSTEAIHQALKNRTKGASVSEFSRKGIRLSPRSFSSKGKSKFKPGSQVRHPKYGIGTVLRSEGDGEDLKLSVSFPRYGLKKLLEKFAGLENL